MLADLAASMGLPADLAFIAVNGSVEGGTTTFLGCTGAMPIVAFKVARHDAAGRRLAAEAGMLQRLSTTSAPVSNRLPRVLAFRPELRHGVMAASIVAGKPMSVRTGADGTIDLAAAAQDLARSLDWLADFQLSTRSTEEAAKSGTRRRLLAAADEFRDTFRLTAEQRARLAAMTDNVDEQLSAGVVAEHGDFCRQNILCDPDGNVSGVIDWTFGRESGLPLNDLFYCCILYFLQARRRPGRVGMVAEFEATVLSPDAPAQLVRRLANAHCARLTLDTAVVHDALGWLLIERSLFDAMLFRECRNRGGVPRWMLSIANECNAAPDDQAGHQFWFSLFEAFAARGIAG